MTRTFGASFHPGLYRLLRHPPPVPAPQPTPALTEPEKESAPASPGARDYEGFRALLNNRRMELGLSFIELDHLAQMQGGYSAKLLSPPREAGQYYKRIGHDSMNKLLEALGVEIHIMPGVPRNDDSESEELTYPHVVLLRERGRRGQAAWMAKTNPRKRLEWARKAARARWKRR